MLGKVKKLLSKNTNRTAFFGYVNQYFPCGSNDYFLIEKAYDTAKNAFRHKMREGGDRYFEHLRAVALIIMVYLRVRDAELISAALLHDIVEDIDRWTQKCVALEFTQRVAEIVWWMSKQPVSDFGGDKEARNRHYHGNLGRAPRAPIILKLADRLHNLLSLHDVLPEKRLRKIQETQDFYLAFAEKEIILIHEIEEALHELQTQ